MRAWSIGLALALTVTAFGQNPNVAIYPAGIATDSNLFVASARASTTLTAPMGAADTTINVASTGLFIVPTIVTIDLEEVAVCSKTITTFATCASGRGFNSTTATTHATSPGLLQGLTSTWFVNQDKAEIKAIETNAANTTLSYSNPAWIAALAATKLTGLGAVVTALGTLSNNTTGTAVNVTGIVLEATGGTGANNVTGVAGHYLRSNGTHYVDNTIQIGDVPTLNQNTTGYAAGLAGGAAGSLPYQTAANATGFLASVGYSVAVTGATNPQYATPTANGQCFMSGAASYATTVPSFQGCPSSGGGATTSSQLTDLLWTRTSATVLTMTTGGYVQVNGAVCVVPGGQTITNSSGSGLTARIYVSDGSDGQSPCTLVVLNSFSSGLTCAGGCVVVNNVSAFPQGQGGIWLVALWTATGTPGNWDVSGYSEERAVYGGGVNLKSANGNCSFTYASSGTTINCSGSGSGTVNITEDIFLGSGAENNAVGAQYPGQWEIDSTATAPAVGVTGGTQTAFAWNISNSGTPTMYHRRILPSTWISTGGIDLHVYWADECCGSGNVKWTASIGCALAGSGQYQLSAGGSAAMTYNASSSVTSASGGAGIMPVKSDIIGLTLTNCAANSQLFLRLLRDNSVGSNVGGVVKLLYAVLTIRKTNQ